MRYLPAHAHGNLFFKHCADGVITSKNAHYVFVRFGTNRHSQAVEPKCLVRLVDPEPLERQLREAVQYLRWILQGGATEDVRAAAREFIDEHPEND